MSDVYLSSFEVLDALPVPALVARGAGQSVVFVNTAFRSLIGYTAEAIGNIESWWHIAYPDQEYRAQIQQRWGKAVSERAGERAPIQPVEARIRCKDGTDRYFETHATLLGDGSGQDENLVVFVDVTERASYVRHIAESEALRRRSRELEASLAYNRSLFETLPIGLALCRMDGSLVDVNDAFANIIGRTIDETLALSYWDITPRKYEAQEAEQIEILGARKRYGPYEKEYIHKDGHFVPVRLQGELITLDGETFIWSSVENITDRVRAERKLAESARRAEVANKAKTDLLANMSHEFRTPLNAILGFSSIILDQTFGPISNPKYLEYVSDISSSGMHLLNLINDVLDMSAIEAGRLKLFDETVSVSDLLSPIMRLVQPQADAKGIAISAHLPGQDVRVVVDVLRIKQSLINVISNAVKFTRQSGRVSVSVLDANGGGIDFVIEDTGIGMNAEELKIALDRFGQVESGLNRTHEGSGLGLPLTVELVKLHGGEFFLESEKGSGTRATIRLPASRVLSEGTP